MKPNTKILLIEDDLIDQMAFKRLVSEDKLPYSYTISSSFAEASAILNQDTFDVIFTDFNLGDGTAFDVLRISGDIPVIIGTGAGDQEIAVKAMKAGARDYLIKDPDRKYLTTLAITVEASIKHHQAEKQFKMLSHTLMSISDSVWISSLEGNITFVNKAFLKTYGYDEQEIIGKPIDIIYSPASKKDNAQNIQMDTLCGGWEGEIVSARKDGYEFPIFLSTSIVYNENQQPMALTGVAKDITEQKKATAELKRAKELAEAANKSKSEFLANMSHEIRTPMNGILGMIELSLDTQLTEEQEDYLKIVRTSADSLLTIINDILDFSKIEVGKLQLSLVEFSLNAIIVEVMQAFQHRAEQKGISLNYCVDPKLPEKLIGDPVRVNQIIINLVGNAIKFTSVGGVVFDVKVNWLKKENVSLFFSVVDTGIGIPASQKKNIFRSFEQADGSTTRKFGGTGLGLAISAQLVKLMDGKIWVESPPTKSNRLLVGHGLKLDGEGSSFNFDIEFKIADADTIADLIPDEINKLDVAATKDENQRAQLSILVAEDNNINQKVAKRLLEKMNHKVQIANNGVEAIESLEKRNNFDLVFMDIQMPEMDGFEATSIIREKEKQGNVHVPIVALTANAMKGDKERCLAAGMDEYVSKPINKRELEQVINKILRQKSEPIGQI